MPETEYAGRAKACSEERDNGRVLTPDGLRLICAAYENDPEKIGIHMLEMLAKFRNEGIIGE